VRASARRIGERDDTRNSGRMIFYTLSLINVQLAQSRLDDTAREFCFPVLKPVTAPLRTLKQDLRIVDDHWIRFTRAKI